jgi:hypothetical protein
LRHGQTRAARGGTSDYEANIRARPSCPVRLPVQQPFTHRSTIVSKGLPDRDHAFALSGRHGISESSKETIRMNKFERRPAEAGEAKVEYLDGDFRILRPGGYVRCAVSGEPIPLDELRYWSVDRQEAYASPAASMQRERERSGRA